ncbi:DUF3558 family protein [Dietzia sp. KRD202]|uniref:DUF3558 family protein n=1 Tax=Dietzia sp. KRD202 TaxID=2729732 RepID=UPI0035AFE492
MNAYRPDGTPSELRRRDFASRTAGRGNRSAARPVVQVVGKSRAFVAALVAAGVVLSGCASADGGEDTSTTTSPAAAEEPGNPWDLPIEQRPALFDPCAEIPVEAIEEGVSSPVRQDEQLRIHQPGDLFACGWKNEEVIFGVLSTWKSRGDYLGDDSLVASESQVAGRPSLRLLSKADMGDNGCQQSFFTSEGTLIVSVDLIHGLSAFKGENFADPCSVLDESILSVMPYLSEGDFQ